MTLATRRRPYWTCRRCGFRNLRAHVKCRGAACTSKRPKPRVPAHAKVLQELTYEQAVQASYAMHGRAVEMGACGVCGRLPSEARPRLDRDHDHKTGAFRGLACWRCNRELLRGHTVETLKACLAYLERAASGT